MQCSELLHHGRISRDEKLNIYLFGSRVYGTALPDADYDFFIITTDDYFATLGDQVQQDTNHPFHEQWTQYRKNDSTRTFRTLALDIPNDTSCYSVNINLYKQSAWKELLEKNWFQSLLCYFLPQEFIWRYDLDINFKIYHRKVLESVVGEAGKHFQFAQASWRQTQGDHYIEKKYIIHTFRDLLFGIQIVKFDRIVDYKQANEIYYEVMSHTETEWDFYYRTYYHRYQELKQQFGQIIDEIACLHVQYEKNKSVTLQFLTENTLETLTKALSVDVTQHPSNPSLAHLTCREEAPTKSQVSNESGNGLILKQCDSFSLVAVSTPRVLVHDDKSAPKLQWKSVTVTKIRITSLLVTLYWYDQWRIFTHDSPDASDVVDDCVVAELFWNLLGDQIPEEKDYSFVFRLCCTLQQRYLSLEAVVDTQKVKQIPIDSFVQKYGYELCPDIVHESFKNVNRVKILANELDPVQFSDIWVTDAQCNRIRVPCTQRMSLTRLLFGSASQSDMINVLRTNQSISMDNAQFLEEKKNYCRLCEYLNDTFMSLSGIPDKKTFAESVMSINLEGWFEPSEKHPHIRSVILNVLDRMRGGSSATQVLSQSDHEKLVFPLYSFFDTVKKKI
jgi:hypothetical protein